MQSLIKVQNGIILDNLISLFIYVHDYDSKTLMTGLLEKDELCHHMTVLRLIDRHYCNKDTGLLHCLHINAYLSVCELNSVTLSKV